MQVKCQFSEMVETNKLMPHPRNANKHGERQIELLAKNIDYQGWRLPIVVSKRSSCVVAGHGRLEAAKKLGLEKVPVSYQDFGSDAEEFQFLISDNKLASLAEHDDALMIEGIRDLQIDDFELLGLDDFSLEIEIDPAKDEIEDDVPEQVDTRCKPGDLWILGEHRLLCGDATNVQHVERLMNGEKADMVFTDPPYGVSIKNTKGEILGDQSLDVFRDCIPLLDSCSKETAHVYVYFGVQYIQECLELLNSVFKQYNILVQRITHENKPSPPGYFKSNYELCYFSNKSGRPFNHGHADVSETTLNDSRYMGDGKMKTYKALIEEKATEHNLKSVHPTQKTVGICEFYQNISSNKDDIVLDLFGGSGSTLIACEKTNRKCYMMEIDPHYCDVILTRWENYTGKKAVLK